MSDPFDTANDPLLAELGQLGVPSGGVPVASGAVLLAKAAAAAPVVIGLAGAKLYTLLGGILLVGFGSGVFASRAMDETTDRHEVSVVVPAIDEMAPRDALVLKADPLGAGRNPESPSGPERDDQRVSDGAMASAAVAGIHAPAVSRVGTGDSRASSSGRSPTSRLELTGRRVECPEPATAGNEGRAVEADDSWIPDPAPRAEPLAVIPGVDDDRGASPLMQQDGQPDDLDDTIVDGTALERRSAEAERDHAGASVSPGTSATRHGLQPAEGHLRAGLGGGALLYPGSAAPDLVIAVGLQLLTPGPRKAAGVLALNLDAGVASQNRYALGTLGIDGEFGLALRPRGELRFELGGIGGVRLLQANPDAQSTTLERPEEIPQDVWDRLSEEERRERGVLTTSATGPSALPAFGARFGVVVGRIGSPLSFRASLFGQAMLVNADGADRLSAVPAIGGTLGLDILLPTPRPAKP